MTPSCTRPTPLPPPWSMLRLTLDRRDALRAGLAVGLGALSGMACGAPPDLVALAASVLLAGLASAAWQWQAAATHSGGMSAGMSAGNSTTPQPALYRDAAQLAALAAAGVTVLLAARSSPAPLAFGLGLALLGRWRAAQPTRREGAQAGWTALATGAGVALWVLLADAVQRHGTSRFALLAALAPALSVAAAEWSGSALPPALRRLGAAVLLWLAQLWLAGWSWAQWLPTGAAWALLAAPLAAAALVPARPDRARALAYAAALLQALLLAAAYARVLALRG